MKLTGKEILDIAHERNQNAFVLAYVMRHGFSSIEEFIEAGGHWHEFSIWIQYAHRAIAKLEHGKKFYYNERFMPIKELVTVEWFEPSDEGEAWEEFMDLLAIVHVEVPKIGNGCMSCDQKRSRRR